MSSAQACLHDLFKAQAEKTPDALAVVSHDAQTLFARAETLLNNDGVSDTSRPLSRGWPISVILAVLALLILLAECMLYHRRKVG